MTRIVAIFCLLCMPLVAYAQNCQAYRAPTFNHHNNKVVVVKEVYVPVAVPVVIPATVFQYLPALAPQQYQQPQYQQQQQPQYQQSPTVQTQPVQTQYPQTQTVQPQNGVPPAADIDRMIIERVDRVLAARLKTLGHNDDGPPPLILATDLPNRETPNKDIPTRDKEPRQDNNIDQQVAQILANHCSSCHTQGAKTSGNVTLFTQKDNQLLFQPGISKAEIWKVVNPQTLTMPPTAKGDPNAPTAIKGNDLVLLKRWAGIQ